MSSSSSAFWNKQFIEGSLSAAAGRFWHWYKRECFSFFSPATVAWLLDKGDRKLVLRASDGAKELRFADGEPGAADASIRADELLESSVERALARRGVPRDAAKISLEVPRDAFFVQSWILRRDIVARALEGSGVAIGDLDTIAPERAPGDQDEGPVIALGRRADGSRWFRAVVIGLSALAAALAIAGLTAMIWRQNEAMTRLDASIAEVSSRATRVRKIADQAVAQSRLLAILREERERGPLLADLWEEVSRILPDDAYLSEFRLSEVKSGERVLDMIGYADSAVRLPALFDKSPMFSDASLTAAITPDVQAKREAFSLRARVKQKDVAGVK
jgi:general secretion pathway protein L